MFEPDVTLTDYIVTVECVFFAYLLLSAMPDQRFLRIWFAVFFFMAGAAAFLGGTRHGFFPDRASSANQMLDVASMVALGLTSLAAWIFGAVILFGRRVSRIATAVASIEFVLYVVCLLFYSKSFLVAIVNYLPSAIFALSVFGLFGIRYRARAAWVGVAGVLLIFIGAAAQQAKLGLHPDYFTYNSVYHVIQSIAMYLVFVFARWLVGNPDLKPVFGRDR